jgi:hypothetical protein
VEGEEVEEEEEDAEEDPEGPGWDGAEMGPEAVSVCVLFQVGMKGSSLRVDTRSESSLRKRKGRKGMKELGGEKGWGG